MRMLALPRVSGFLIGLLAVLIGLSGCGTKDPVSRGRIDAFDTVMEVTLIGVDRQRAVDITRVLEADLRLMEAAWQASGPGPVSHMNTLFNEGAAPFAAPPSVLPLLRLSKKLSEQSEDLFNPAIGHLTRAWGFQGREPECLQPAPEEIIELIVNARPSMRDISIDGLRVSSRKQTVKLDFSGIQKGFAIDQAIARLQEFGVQNASIDAAGDLRAIGSRAGHPWSVAIRGPEGGGVLATLQISGNEAAFTEGLRAQLHLGRRDLPRHHRSTHGVSGFGHRFSDRTAPQCLHRRCGRHGPVHRRPERLAPGGQKDGDTLRHVDG
ncbi:MAG: FAD:protein FMN transferase [Gammaproteobacteria bacterium]|nr:FAD:protein FMN transferase [Gammaproteobacteria bacterium]